MRAIMVVLLSVTAVLMLIAGLQGGVAMVVEGLLSGWATLRGAALLIILAFAITGLMQVLVEPATIKKWLGRRAGWRGVAIGAAAGALTPGGPYVYYPLALAIHRSGAGMGTIFAYLAGKAVWDLARLPLEIAFMGPGLTALRWAATMLAPPVLGYLGGRWFGDYRAPQAGGEQP